MYNTVLGYDLLVKQIIHQPCENDTNDMHILKIYYQYHRALTRMVFPLVLWARGLGFDLSGIDPCFNP